MTMERKEFVGLALGAWGAVQATAAGLSIAFGGAARDAVSTLALEGSLGPALAVPVTGYSFVYYTEICLLFITLAAIGPLVRRANLASASEPAKSERFGLADLPG
jgi:BCD family chlorophyll transporter-like MFS transporter